MFDFNPQNPFLTAENRHFTPEATKSKKTTMRKSILQLASLKSKNLTPSSIKPSTKRSEPEQNSVFDEGNTSGPFGSPQQTSTPKSYSTGLSLKKSIFNSKPNSSNNHAANSIFTPNANFIKNSNFNSNFNKNRPTSKIRQINDMPPQKISKLSLDNENDYLSKVLAEKSELKSQNFHFEKTIEAKDIEIQKLKDKLSKTESQHNTVQKLRKNEIDDKHALLRFVEQVLGWTVFPMENGFGLRSVMDNGPDRNFKFNNDLNEMSGVVKAGCVKSGEKQLLLDYEQAKSILPVFLSEKLDMKKELTSTLGSIFALYSLDLAAKIRKPSGENEVTPLVSDSQHILSNMKSGSPSLEQIIKNAFGFEMTENGTRLKSKFSKNDEDYIDFHNNAFEANGVFSTKYGHRLADTKNELRLCEVLMSYQTQLFRNKKENGGIAINRYADYLKPKEEVNRKRVRPFSISEDSECFDDFSESERSSSLDLIENKKLKVEKAKELVAKLGEIVHDL
jgi:hypothetical protein